MRGPADVSISRIDMLCYRPAEASSAADEISADEMSLPRIPASDAEWPAGGVSLEVQGAGSTSPTKRCHLLSQYGPPSWLVSQDRALTLSGMHSHLASSSDLAASCHVEVAPQHDSRSPHRCHDDP